MRNIPFGKFPLMKNNPRTFAKRPGFLSRIPVWKSVDAYWHPLTPEHGFPSLNSYKAQGAPPRPAAIRRIHFSFLEVALNKNRRHLRGYPVKIHLMTSYDGIIRIR